MLALTKEMVKIRELEQYIKNTYPEFQVLEIQSDDAVQQGSKMLLFGSVSEWVRIMSSNSSNLTITDWLQKHSSVEGFCKRLFDFMNNKGISGPELDRKAQITRSVFSDVQSGNLPSKKSAVKICLALELSLKQTMEMLQLAGYTFSRNRKEDLIVMYCILKKEYNIFTIDEILYSDNCQTLNSQV